MHLIVVNKGLKIIKKKKQASACALGHGESLYETLMICYIRVKGQLCSANFIFCCKTLVRIDACSQSNFIQEVACKTFLPQITKTDKMSSSDLFFFVLTDTKGNNAICCNLCIRPGSSQNLCIRGGCRDSHTCTGVPIGSHVTSVIKLQMYGLPKNPLMFFTP